MVCMSQGCAEMSFRVLSVLSCESVSQFSLETSQLHEKDVEVTQRGLS